MSIYGEPLERLSTTSPATPEGKVLQRAVLEVLMHNNLNLIMDPAVKAASETIIERSQLMGSTRGQELIADVQQMWKEAVSQNMKWVDMEACIALVKLDAGDTLDQALPQPQNPVNKGWARLGRTK
ncbi:hypothetical protein [Dyella silvatica]|uniref:hypothetical protein n=1 Tax=Dyella silvatica TaxID=2992128 RepID=UPI002251FDA9|nr:hypothetical protein [Dyella silvatica]